jgi:hypothetical protein
MDQPTNPTAPTPAPAQPNQAAQPNPPANKPDLISPNKIYQPQVSQNLMNPITIVEDHSGQRWKTLIFDILAVIAAGGFGYSFARYLAGGGFSFWWVFVALLVWSAIAAVVGFIQKDMGHRFLVALFESAALVVFFYTVAWQAIAIAGVLILLCQLFGYFSIRRELGNTIEVRFFTASSKAVGKVVTAAVIFMIIMYGSIANNNGNLFVSEGVFNSFFNWTGAFVNKFYPSVPVTGSFGDFAQAIAQMQLQGNPAFQSLPAAQQSQAVADSAQQFMSGFTTSTNAATMPTSNVFYDYFVNLFSNLQNRYNDLFIGGWGLLLFLILRSIGIIVVWVGQFVTLILYEILLATGFMKITEHPATKETIEI